MRLLCAAVLACALAVAVPQAHNDCDTLWHQLDDALDDLYAQLDANEALANVVFAPGFDPVGPDGWMVGALVDGTAEAGDLQRYVSGLGAEIQAAQCY